eukprot:TRINITY_DN1689_c0_g1_i5.p1 TRINITY_DN1689_c0_g1~~TRINITY_DN1689_c0_g1_i5.p1  ORF type:complete len:136 (-),score=7.99 TRINITY_DN1689_c0_g1_i5:934-1341(-)
MIRRPPRSTLSSSSAASDVYKRQYQRRVREKIRAPCRRNARRIGWTAIMETTQRSSRSFDRSLSQQASFEPLIRWQGQISSSIFDTQSLKKYKAFFKLSKMNYQGKVPAPHGLADALISGANLRCGGSSFCGGAR